MTKFDSDLVEVSNSPTRSLAMMQAMRENIHRLESMVENMSTAIDSIDENEPESESLAKMLSAWADLDSDYTEYSTVS